ncbi:hypothetical protein DERP_010233 [Dermatophagoides pteronyssinus]|uniref:Uncharacterized protein n=1 Tax=Dermatophagoides pteronyssinus TaxID=6956 RepID=A0ABQ8J700_DERPT|nr:hypothetical protein DERP_010233 [Dermatophagoides pteronyssinus]
MFGLTVWRGNLGRILDHCFQECDSEKTIFRVQVFILGKKRDNADDAKELKRCKRMHWMQKDADG